MVNYDLPWNPNRLEQRFGRIHRIGQTEVCHLWNLVAKDTREGEVHHRLLEKLDEERKALGGQVFDVLGELTFEDRPLRQLLLGGTIHEREPQRFEIRHVPAVIRNRDRQIGRGLPVLTRYERATFEKDLISVAERRLGFEPRDVSAGNLGYDVESAIPDTGKLRFIEVNGRIKDAQTVTITKNEILTALNKPEDFILAIGLIDGEEVDLSYVRRPFEKEPDFNATSVNYALPKLLAGGGPPS